MKRSELISIRDTVQSIWVAIILAFVLRAFVLEAFVIPTGSMAPRLMGRHARIQCPECGYSFARGLDQQDLRGLDQQGPRVGSKCPNCGERITSELKTARQNKPRPGATLVKGGDRVLVLKVPRQLRPLERWDVVVFKNPQGNIQNYIKRLIGLPGEVIRIVHGDIFVHELSDRNGDGIRDENDVDASLADLADWKIARKPLVTQEAMWQVLFDNDYRPALRPQRSDLWEPLWRATDPDAGAWKLDVQQGRVFQFDGEQPASVQFAAGRRDVFKAINAYSPGRGSRIYDDTCSDLKLETTILPADGAAKVLLTLSSFDDEFAGEIDFSGRVRLLHRKIDADGKPESSWDEADVWRTDEMPTLADGRAVSVALTHADWRVSLLIDGEPVLVSSDEVYRPDMAALLAASKPQSVMADRGHRVAIPRVGVTGAGGSFQLWRTRVMRDEFYVQVDLRYASDQPHTWVPEEQYALTYFQDGANGPSAKAKSPGWGMRDNPIALRKFADRSEFDEFFMLGDNSPSSQDSRLWVKASPTLRLFDADGKPQYRLGTVPRYNLIGKAFFVYWPAGSPLPMIPQLPRLRLPIIPDVGKMRRID